TRRAAEAARETPGGPAEGGPTPRCSEGAILHDLVAAARLGGRRAASSGRLAPRDQVRRLSYPRIRGRRKGPAPDTQRAGLDQPLRSTCRAVPRAAVQAGGAGRRGRGAGCAGHYALFGFAGGTVRAGFRAAGLL